MKGVNCDLKKISTHVLYIKNLKGNLVVALPAYLNPTKF